MWVVVGVGGLAIAGLGALLLGSAWDGYIAANPGYRGDVVNPPPASAGVATQAFVAMASVAFGYLIALVASLMRLRRTSGGWMLLRALAALTPLPILWLWLSSYFQFFVSNVCSDCSPPQPIIPGVFEFGNDVLVGAALLGLVLFLVFVAFALFSFARTRKRPGDLPTQ